MKAIAIALGSVLLFVGCGDDAGAIGSSCSTPGATTGQCSAGAVCGMHADSDSAATCLKVCSQQSDCATSEDCNGVSGTSLKGCRAKSSTTSGASGTGVKK